MEDNKRDNTEDNFPPIGKRPVVNIKTPTRSKGHINMPSRNIAALKDYNPVSSRGIRTSNTGVISFSAGNVYFDFNASDESKSEKLYFKVLIRDEWGNLTDMLRNSNKEDYITEGSYVSNQSIRSIPYTRTGRANGKTNKLTDFFN
jgi:hypothetical protein